MTLPILLALATSLQGTGKHAVGSRAFTWTDQSRIDELARGRQEHRTLNVTVLFPADPKTGATAPYLRDLALWRTQVAEARLKEAFGAAYPAVAGVETAIRQDAAIAAGKERFPLLVFLPGLGMNVAVYTALLADLASHGYVVLAINPTYEVFAATLAPNRAVGFSSPGWFQSPVEKILQYERRRLLVWAADAAFAIGQLENQGIFKARIDWRKVGALGHSAGARVAAHLCQSEARVSAYLNLDGFAGFEPFFAEPGSVFERRFAMIHMALPEPPDEQMLREKTRQRNSGIRLFESVRSGSVEVTLSTPGIQHGSFTDLPILGSAAGDPQRAMTHIRAYSLAFFDRALKGRRRQVPPSPDVLVERYRFKRPVTTLPPK